MTPDKEERLRQLVSFEKDIANAMLRYNKGEIDSISLATGGEEVDLSANADLLVRGHGRPERVFYRDFGIRGEPSHQGQSAGDDLLDDFYASGGPLIIVRQMSADVIARGVLKYLRIEKALQC
jgi:hypothetical protein